MENIQSFTGGLCALLLLTAFVKVFTTLTILRFGMGLTGAGLGVIVFALSAALSLLISSPELSQVGGREAFFSGEMFYKGKELQEKLQPFIENNAPAPLRQRLDKLIEQLGRKKDGDPAAGASGVDKTFVVQAAFLLSELRQAVELGFLILIPFLVVDLVVANAFMALGVAQLQYQTVSLPLKLILFFAVDGWSLISEKLIRSYI